VATSPISFTTTGSTARTRAFLQKMQTFQFKSFLEGLGQRGVIALSNATPVDSGLTAASWSYEIVDTGGSTNLTWINTHNESGVNIAIILQYGHGTGTGGYVAGRDYINPAIQPIFDQILTDLWKQVTSA
jgi:hypothetical protein